MLAPYPINKTAEAFLWFPAVHGSSEDSDSDTWMLEAPLPLMDPSPVSEGMNSDSASSCSEPEITADHEESQGQLDLFRKLGFSEAQVHAARLKRGVNADTNTVLGELVQVGMEQESYPRVVIPHKTQPSAHHAPRQQDLSMDDDALKPIVIDGSNVAMSHGNKEVFSCLGIQLAVNYFLDRGHMDITVFVPLWRREAPRPDVPITDQHILRELERRKILVFTPSRRVAGKRVVCYDDRFIVKLAHESDGIIVSNDTYRDLQGERPEWKRFIEDRLLMYSFVNDKFMVPDDPLGRRGPTLENFLRKTPRVVKRPPCPYGKKCTYGIKCKFSHPERPKQSNRALADELREKAKQPALPTTPHKHPSMSSVSFGPEHGLPLEEMIKNNLHLGLPEVAPKGKAQATENVLVLDGVPPSSKKQCFKKDRHNQIHSQGNNHRQNHSHNPSHSHSHSPSQNLLASMDCKGSYKCLDSGLGSIEPHHEDNNGDSRKSRSIQSKRQYYPPAPSNGCQSCPCCPLPPPPVLHAPTPAQANLRYPHHVISSHGSEMSSFAPPCYPPYSNLQRPASLPQTNMAGYCPRQPGHFCVPQHGPWSAPYPTPNGYTHSIQGVHSTGEQVQHHPWGTPMAPPVRSSRPGSRTREEVRKNLMAIFNGHLVDRAMEMFPELLDAQRLAAEILTLQSQEGNL